MPDKQEKYKDMCFVIMPIGDSHAYDHYKHVYDDIFAEAIKSAGFKPKRADDDKSSSMIQVEIIRDIVSAPMAICDLSSRNPNVLFELGIRQAFDLPVVLVQEVGTPRIFDISTINTIEYRKDRIYHEVLEDRKKIEEALNATKDNTKGINSIIKLLGINKAEVKGAGEFNELDEIRVLLYSLINEIKDRQESKYLLPRDSYSAASKELPPYIKLKPDFVDVSDMSIEERINEIEDFLEDYISIRPEDVIILEDKFFTTRLKVKSSNITRAQSNKYINKLNQLYEIFRLKSS
ncbi:hypothetical protein [Lachnoclostridium sp.]|uniref:hypothetical protein n=1 Tax=Lachnoclostridium sp. TaxID=2028282 RepID=UPI00289E8F85|nr:hypothetical protein [Lachnoclostridium sp.]